MQICDAAFEGFDDEAETLLSEVPDDVWAVELHLDFLDIMLSVTVFHEVSLQTVSIFY